MNMTTYKFEDGDITYYTTSNNKRFLHESHAKKYEACLQEEINKANFFKTFYYNEAIAGAKNIAYEDMKQWLKDNQLLVQDMIQEP